MTEPYKPNPDIAVWQMAAVALCEYACGYAAGRNKLDPVYIEVTERRDGPTAAQRAHYSSCGDLGQWLLWRLGVDERWMNRVANGTYNVGMNVSDLGLGCPIAHAPPASDLGYRPGPGDVCEIWNTGNDAHVFVVLGPGSDANHIRTANFGAGGMSAGITPGAAIADSPFVRHGDGWLVGLAHPRKLQRVIRLADAVALVKKAPDLTGAALTGEVIDALQGKWEPAKS